MVAVSPFFFTDKKMEILPHDLTLLVVAVCAFSDHRKRGEEFSFVDDVDFFVLVYWFFFFSWVFFSFLFSCLVEDRLLQREASAGGCFSFFS
jgi:hypothetical protein